ncbi:Putative transporter [Hoyosella subflava DQS3-9A1]|uniref:Putative transporter n=1 Tax=Hoyosella subflava (strain DSM 45089 / JCM 17490 / NBRC 109087 / DQS3-9A1) TaxID=443218 RepID=F6EQD8_HOYSD|nr:Putative transporter [Hoyosella subflava DQS3-9A1]
MAAAVMLGVAFGLGFGGSLRHLSNVVPRDKRGETMSAYFLLAYTAMAIPAIVAGWAATRWELASVYPWFVGAVALACLAAAGLGLRKGRSGILPSDRSQHGLGRLREGSRRPQCC